MINFYEYQSDKYESHHIVFKEFIENEYERHLKIIKNLEVDDLDEYELLAVEEDFRGFYELACDEFYEFKLEYRN